jgi:hypothetical protein
MDAVIVGQVLAGLTALIILWRRTRPEPVLLPARVPTAPRPRRRSDDE